MSHPMFTTEEEKEAYRVGFESGKKAAKIELVLSSPEEYKKFLQEGVKGVIQLTQGLIKALEKKECNVSRPSNDQPKEDNEDVKASPE